MQHTLEHRIRERAYQIWDACGRTDGKADEHWLAAEREVLAGLTNGSSAAEAKSAGKPRGRGARRRIAA